MNIAVSTTCSDGYVIFLDHFIKSILRYNPNFDKDFLIFCDPRLSLTNRTHLRTLYNNFIFKDINYELYQNKRKAHMKYYSIECFNQSYDRVIYWGADMLCKGSLDELWSIAGDTNYIAMPKEKRRGDDCSYNNGSMIIGSKYLNNKTYMDLFEFDNMKPPYNLTDQKLYNYFFKNKIKEIDQKFNTLVTELEFIEWDDILILHYIHKPTVKSSINQLNKLDLRLYKLWSEYGFKDADYVE